MVCNSGVGLTPTHDGQILHFSAGGLYNGMVLLIDDETGSYWDHISGLAVHGTLKGAQLNAWPIEMTNVKSALHHEPELRLLKSRPSPYAQLSMNMMSLAQPFVRGRLLPGFRKTMGQPDTRLPEMELGLGVVSARVQRFYRYSDIVATGPLHEEFDGQSIVVQIGEDEFPLAIVSSGTRPMQLFTRWYGFAYTYPDCEVSLNSRASP